MEVREHNWVLVRVIWVHIPLFHVFDVLLIVSLSIFSSVPWFRSINIYVIERIAYTLAVPAVLAVCLAAYADSNFDLTLKATEAKWR